MNQQTVLQQHLPLGPEYALEPDQVCIDHIGVANHSSYAGGGTVEPLRRDSSLGHSNAGSYSVSNPGDLRYLPHRTAASNGSYQALSGSPGDSGSGSFSTSPSSASSSLAYSSFNNPHPGLSATQNYSTYPQLYSGPANYPQSSHLMYSVRPRIQSLADPSSSVMLSSTRSPGSNIPVTPPQVTNSRDNYTATPHLGRPGLSPRTHNEAIAPHSYNTPRGSYPLSAGPMSLSPSSGGSFSSSATLQAGNYPGTDERTPPFPTLQMNYSLECEGQEITPDIHAKLEKGFFLSNDNIWTCYRRNYFSVNCSYTLNPHLSGRPIYLNRGSNGLEHVQALAITLSAAVDGDKGKTIELLQQTPKRDKGPQLSISKQKVSPMPPNKTLHGPSGILPDATRLQQSYPFAPYGAHTPQVQPPLLPLQGEPDENTQISSPTIAYSSGNTSISASTATSSSSSSSAPFTSQPAGSVSSTSPNSQSHTFERIQFKSATANNGKRRAAQQYYTLIVELHADVRDTSKREKKPVWVKVAQRLSVPVVVRGRSPSHYQEQTNSSSGPAPGSSGGGSGSRSLGGPGSGSTTAGAGYGQRGGWASISGMGGSGASSAGFRSAGFSYDPSPSTSHSVSSASSLEGGAVAEPSSAAGAQQQSHGDTHMHGTGEPEIEPYPGYQYFPSPLYDAMQQTLPKVEGGAHEGKFKDEFGQTSLQFGNKCGPGRFQGVDGSRGHFPDLGAMSGY